MISFKQTISIIELFHFKTPRLGFSFLPPVYEFWNYSVQFFLDEFPSFLLLTDSWIHYFSLLWNTKTNLLLGNIAFF